MAGVVIEVRVKEGQEIKAGDPLLVLSAMKMESVVSSPVSGHVARVVVNPSDSIGQGDRTFFFSLRTLPTPENVLTRAFLRLFCSRRRDQALDARPSPPPRPQPRLLQSRSRTLD